jgi:hypothetical protein
MRGLGFKIEAARSGIVGLNTLNTAMPLVGHERHFRDVRKRVRSTSDSGKIATLQRTDVKGQGVDETISSASVRNGLGPTEPARPAPLPLLPIR